MDTVENYIKHNALHFYLSDSVRHLAAVVPLDAATNGLGLSVDRVVTPQQAAAVIPSAAPTSASSAATSSTSGVYSPTSPPPAGPTIPTAGSSSGGASSMVGGAAGASGGSGAMSNSGIGNALSSMYSFDDMLTEIPQYFQDVLCGRHIAGLSAPWEYILCTKRNRVTFCLALHRSMTHTLPSLLCVGSSPTGKSSTSVQHLDVVAGLLASVAGVAMPIGWAANCSGDVEAGDLQALFVSMVQLHCSDMPKAWLYVILRRAAAMYSRQVGAASSPQPTSSPLPLSPHAILHRMTLLHVYCKELVEDLQAAFPVGGGGAAVDRCRSDMCTWRRTFDRWGLDGSWRCGGPRTAASAAASPVTSVQPYIPVSIVNAMFDSPSSLREAVGSASSSALSPDADAICSLIVHSDDWFLWCTNGEVDEVIACSYT